MNRDYSGNNIVQCVMRGKSKAKKSEATKTGSGSLVATSRLGGPAVRNRFRMGFLADTASEGAHADPTERPPFRHARAY